MDMDSISPEEFRKLQMQVDILQRFLTKTFGSSFLEFCKMTKLSLTKEQASKSKTTQAVPQLNKPQSSSSSSGAVASTSNGNGKLIKVEVSANGNGQSPSTSAASGGGGSSAPRRPPPLLQRPPYNGLLPKIEWGSSSSNGVLTISAGTSRLANKNNGTTTTISKKPIMSKQQQQQQSQENDDGDTQIEFYDDEEANDEDIVQFIQPETVFSDDEQQQQQQSTFQPVKKSGTNSNNGRINGGIKREHSVAFGYDYADDKMNLPEGTECIMIDANADQGQQENYLYQQDDDSELMYENGDANDGEEYYEYDGYSYNLVEDGLEISGNGTGNYTTEELQTDGNVTFGTVITAQDTGIQYFQCAFCPSAKVFKHKQSLKEHYLLNHSPTPPAFQCQCGRRFLKQSQLKRHEVVHTAERPFVCPICGKDFTRKDNMTVHMVRNHAEKKHQCPHCPDRLYATLAEVNRHLRMYHSSWPKIEDVLK